MASPAEPGAGEVTASVVVNAPAQTVFDAFLAWERQGEWIPLTTVRVVSGDGGVGTMIEAVTTLGPAVLRDEMRVERVDPPYEVKVVHCGRLLRGPGVMRCTPLAGEIGLSDRCSFRDGPMINGVRRRATRVSQEAGDCS